LNTHGHGDHVGGNAYLVAHTGARIYAPIYDSVVLQNPLWGTMCMFSGADPLDELRAPRFAAEPCKADVLVAEEMLLVAGVAVKPVSLPGHTASHTGYIVSDVFFTGDVLAGEEELENTHISYAYSVTRRLESLEKLKGYRCARYVLGHGTVHEDIAALIERNIAQVQDVLDCIKAFLKRGEAQASQILETVCAHYGIQARNVREYYLLYPTLHAYLGHLSNSGQIAPAVKDNRLVWSAGGGATRAAQQG
jgi:glyoxylase-like metal-dependent hydrolase (beta-lactamase superfamily II)